MKNSRFPRSLYAKGVLDGIFLESRALPQADWASARARADPYRVVPITARAAGWAPIAAGAAIPAS